MGQDIDWKAELKAHDLNAVPYLRIRKSGFAYIIPLVKKPTSLKELHGLISATHEYVGWIPWQNLRLSWAPPGRVPTEINDVLVEEAIDYAIKNSVPLEAWWNV
eukprot:Phypoly_transcript_12590.p1 GENE.Phypoly_transcript_12590~~Phypoly_transcript_12590.p1  ORF type:complete len:104 (+),score=10.89 Phypoly_transcript_12590:488-799(+)